MLASNHKVFWDPITESITTKSLEKIRSLSSKKIDSIRKNIWLFRFMYVCAFWIKTLGIIFLVYLFLSQKFLASISSDPAFLMMFILSVGFGLCILWWIFKHWVKKNEIDFVKSSISEENNWLYDPSSSVSRAAQINHEFGEVFPNGSTDYVEDQFWGTVGSNNSSFYCGIYNYYRDHDKGTAYYSKAFFFVPLKKELDIYLHLVSSNTLASQARILFSLTSRPKFESADFNDKFFVKKFKSNNLQISDVMSLFKHLTPATQEKLNSFMQEYPKSEILFKDDTIVFTRDSFLFPKKKSWIHHKWQVQEKIHTKLLWRNSVDKRDEELLNNEIIDITSLAQNVAAEIGKNS